MVSKRYLAIAIIIIVVGAIAATYLARRPRGIILRVITRHPYDILEVARKEFLKSEFAKKYHIKDIMWLSVDAPQWVTIIRESAKEKGRGIDVAWGGGPTLFDMLAKKGLLAPLTSPVVLKEVDKIPDEIAGSPMKRKNEKGQIIWVAAAIASFGFTINKHKLAEKGLPLPEKWADLASETYAVTLPTPIIGTADPTRSTSNTRMFEIILQAYGWEKGWKILTLLAANARVYDASGLVRDAVIRGDIGAGTTIDFYGYTAQLQNPEACLYILPKDGTIVNGDPIALLVTSEHPEAAQAFIAWVLSVEGQKIWLDPHINRMPVRKEVFETPEGRKRADLKEAYERTLKASTIKFSDELAASYELAMQWFFHATLVRAHKELQEAWHALAIAKLRGKISEAEFKKLVDEMTNPLKFKFKDPKTGKILVFDQKTAQKLAVEFDKDPDYRVKVVDLWTKLAKERYLKILEYLKSKGIST